jgi:8-oxo-dGTP diphosphatase
MARHLEADRSQEAHPLDALTLGSSGADSTRSDRPVVQAAGGIVWRSVKKSIEVLLVHRPKYDDWTFPKGKLDDGETHEEAALREVEEETGYRCKLGDELVSTSYTDAKGRPKLVRYWEMRVDGGEFRVNDEVDAIRWVPMDEVTKRLSYAHDDAVLEAFRRART